MSDPIDQPQMPLSETEAIQELNEEQLEAVQGGGLGEIPGKVLRRTKSAGISYLFLS